MDDPRTAQGVEHLQVAARELLKAARSFLDVVEDVVDDPERITGAAAGLADLLKSGVGRGPAPWERAAWDHDDDGSDPRADTQQEPAGAGPDVDVDAATSAAVDVADVVDVVDVEVDEPVAAPRSTQGARASRVRRIAVD